MRKFHISKNGKPEQCKAKPGNCPLGNDSQHYDSKEKAQQNFEKEQSKNSNIFTSFHSDTVFRIKELKKEIESILTKEKVSLKELDHIGNLMNKEVEKRLSFNANDLLSKDFTQRHYDEIQEKNREVFSEIIEAKQGTNRIVNGPRSKDLESTITILPDGAKNFVGDYPIETKTISKKSALGGSHRLGVIPVSVPLKEEASPYEDPGDKVKDGDFFSNSSIYLSDLENGQVDGFRIMQKGDNQQYWVGKKPAGKKGWKKVSNEVEVYVSGKIVKVEKPVYKMYTQENAMRTELTIPKADTESAKSTIIHEYSHAIQIGYYQSLHNAKEEPLDVEMYNKIKGEKTYSETYNLETHKGFPDEYMGSSDRELFPMATEGYFNTSASHRGYLYGKDRHENADKIKNWVTGFWLHLDQQGKQIKQ